MLFLPNYWDCPFELIFVDEVIYILDNDLLYFQTFLSQGQMDVSLKYSQILIKE